MMNIYYNDKTLYVNVDELRNIDNLHILKKRVFGILNDYDIENIVLNLITDSKNNEYLDEFILEYNQKYRGNLVIK